MSLNELRSQWTLDDVLNAHDVLDLYELAEHKAAKKVEAESRAARRGR